MESIEVADLFVAAFRVGEVRAVRQEYQVFRTASGGYVVLSPSNRGSASFHMTVVSPQKVEAVEKAMRKGKVTSGSLLKQKEVVEAFGTDGLALRFDLLMALYVLTALGKADMEKEGRNLVFVARKEA